MDETQFVDGFNGQHTFSNVEPRYVLGEGVVFDQHCHKISSGQELHNEIEIDAVLEGIEQLHDPRRVGFCKDITFSSDMGKLLKM